VVRYRGYPSDLWWLNGDRELIQETSWIVTAITINQNNQMIIC